MTTLLPEEEINDVLLCDILEKAGFDFNLDTDGQIYVKDGEFPFWIDIQQDRKFLRFLTYISVKKTERLCVLETVNLSATNVMLASFSYVAEPSRFYGEYWMTYRHGLIQEQFLQIARRFASVFKTAIVKYDPENLLGEEP